MKYVVCFVFILVSTTLIAQNNNRLLLQREFANLLKEGTVKDWFTAIEKQQIVLSYNPAEINLDERIKIRQPVLTINELLYKLLDDRKYSFLARENKIIIIKKPSKFTVSGFIKEAGSREAFIGATISIENTNYGTVSNSYGFYSITVPEGNQTVRISYVGYVSQTFDISLQENKKLDIFLQSYDTQLTKVEIATTNPDINIKSDGMHRLNLQTKDKNPQLLGVDDPLQRLRLLPGVGEGTATVGQLRVRGGNSDHNLVLLDGVPIYNYSHYPGLLSIFNNDALKHVDFYKGAFPARYDGRLSSVIDVRMREGDMETYHAGASVDFATVAAFAEGPLVKDKSSFLVSARRSWADLVAAVWKKDIKIDFSLHDFNLKTNYELNKKNHLYLSVYKGADVFWDSYSSARNKRSLTWSNRLAALRWNHVFSDKLFSNTTLSTSSYKNSLARLIYTDTSETQMPASKKTIDYHLSEITFNTELERFGEINHLRLGTKLTKNNFIRPHLRALYDEMSEAEKAAIKSSTLHWMTYIENEVKFKEKIHINLGLNYNLYSVAKDIFHRFQSRVQINYALKDNHNLFAGFSQMNQFFHQLSINTLSMPYDFRMPATKRFQPAISSLYEMGYRGWFNNRKHEIISSVYYNDVKGLVRYRPEQSVADEILAPEIQDQIIAGRRVGKGFELLYKFKNGPFNFTGSYCFADIKEQFKELNNSNPYPIAGHMRHVLKTSLTYNFLPMHHLTLAFTYNSGQYITAPMSQIPDIDNILGLERYYGEASKTIQATRYNNYLMRDNYLVNIGYLFDKKIAAKKGYTFKAGIYNILGKAAPISVTIEKDGALEAYRLYQTNIPAFMPYLSFSYKL